jgi:hypothetical protein
MCHEVYRTSTAVHAFARLAIHCSLLSPLVLGASCCCIDSYTHASDAIVLVSVSLGAFAERTLGEDGGRQRWGSP